MTENPNPALETLKEIARNRLFRLLVIVGVILIALWLFISSIFLTPAQKPQTITDLGLSPNNYPSLSGKNLLYYNGLSFIKTDLSDGKSKSLSNVFLPGVTSVLWAGEDGAIVTVDQLKPYTSLDKYYQINMSDRYSHDYPNKDFPWYVDFSSNTVTPVEDISVSGRDFSYNSKDKLLYFLSSTPIGDNDYEDDTPIAIGKVLVVWSVTDKKVTEQISLFDNSEVRSLSQCDGYAVCIATLNHTNNESKLFGMNGNSINELYSTKNTLSQTNNPSLFAIIDTSKSGETSEDMENAQDKIVSEITLFNTRDKTITNPGLTLHGSTDLVVLYKQNDITVYANYADNELKSLYQSTSVAGNLAVSSSVSSVDKNGIFHLYPSSFSNDIAGAIAFASSKPTTYYIGDGKLAGTPPKNDADSLVGSCVSKQKGSSYNYLEKGNLFSIFLQFDQDYQKNVLSLNDCLFKDASKTYNYNFKVSGTDPSTGKIIIN